MPARKLPLLPVLVCALWLPVTVAGATARPAHATWIEDDRLLVRLVPHTPAQMAAFYEARGFPPAALERIRQTCFITLIIRNRGHDTLWADLDQWKFLADGKEVTRLGERYWQRQWDDIRLRQASRSTFGWTQFPRVRDLQPDEPAGGNIVFPGSVHSLDIEAVLPTGAERKGPSIHLGFGNITCPKDAPDP